MTEEAAVGVISMACVSVGAIMLLLMLVLAFDGNKSDPYDSGDGE